MSALAEEQGLDPAGLREGIYSVHLEANNVAIIAPGTVRFPDGSMYLGSIIGGKRGGRGRWVTNTGEYDGEWRDGLRHGNGTERNTATGGTYEGAWVADVREGLGRETFADGCLYEGRYVANRMCGVGELHFPNGDRYEGEFRDDQMHGKGRLVYSNGDVLEGAFAGGMRHGDSLITYSTGKKVRCTWTNDTPGLLTPA